MLEDITQQLRIGEKSPLGFLAGMVVVLLVTRQGPPAVQTLEAFIAGITFMSQIQMVL
ncbi:hypothetical protein [Halobacterium wangiae]|uniref:hypothetical protein n=1 Tax=Halobacterium wangiae TaxID=2902623 RepID=UPI001E33F968|nr:hypothetical protein [Halobacterium wangiae]